MARRFSRLRYALKTLKTPGTIDDTGAAVVAPAGTVLAKFQKAQAEGVEYGERSAGSKTKGLVLVSVNPFAIGYASDNLKGVYMSKRAFEVSLYNTLKDQLNSVAYVAGTHEVISKYQPAKAVVFQKSTQSSTLKTSKITGIKYNPVDGSSYTFPFGTKTGGTLVAVRGDIITKAATINSIVSFKPEIYPI